MPDLLTDAIAWQHDFKSDSLVKWVEDHAEVPIFASVIYVIFVFAVPSMLKTPWDLRTFNTVWNLALAVFSVCGSYVCLPHLLNTLWTKGFIFTVCVNGQEWYYNGMEGLWMALFMFSKLPELGDTVFLVLQKKDVIFLHWFHHLTVLLYCWHAYFNCIGAGTHTYT
eukprot:c5663_g1_i1.p1 GENE.c5663_g1_i1~~c5663_g1_i1.p1  ORF type:complete len:180 (+),score=29.65 c5663_g1_i1:41-541(+)